MARLRRFAESSILDVPLSSEPASVHLQIIFKFHLKPSSRAFQNFTNIIKITINSFLFSLLCGDNFAIRGLDEKG